jgi:hypothetical protein
MNLKDICNELNKKVNFERYSPVEKIVYTFTALILLGFMGVLVKSYIH